MAFAVRVLLLFATIAQMLAHMRNASGPVYTAHVSSASPSVAGGRADVRYTDIDGARYLLRTCTGEVCAGAYFDGKRFFAVSSNGTTVPRAQDAQDEQPALQMLETLPFLAPNFNAKGGRVADGGDALFDGRRCRRIVVTDFGSTPMAVFVDPRTWLVAGARIGAATYTLRDYRRVGPYALPFEMDKDGKPLVTYTSRDVIDAPLDPPRGLVAKIADRPAAMPLDPESAAPVGACKIAGVSVRCLIDTGNSGLGLSLELAQQLHLQPIGVFEVAGLGEYSSAVVREGPLEIANLDFGNADYVVLNDIHRYGYDLVIGADVLAVMPVQIDFPNHRLVFGADPAPQANTITIPFTLRNFVPTVDVTLEDVAATLAVDTGDDSNINLADDYYREHPTLFHANLTENVSGVGGQSVEFVGEIARLRIGAYTASNQQIGATQMLRGTGDGHLGDGFLSQFRVFLDYARQRMELVPKDSR